MGIYQSKTRPINHHWTEFRVRGGEQWNLHEIKTTYSYETHLTQLNAERYRTSTRKWGTVNQTNKKKIKKQRQPEKKKKKTANAYEQLLITHIIYSHRYGRPIDVCKYVALGATSMRRQRRHAWVTPWCALRARETLSFDAFPWCAHTLLQFFLFRFRCCCGSVSVLSFQVLTIRFCVQFFFFFFVSYASRCNWLIPHSGLYACAMPNITFLFNLLIIIEEETEQAHIAHFVYFAGVVVVVVCKIENRFCHTFRFFCCAGLGFLFWKREILCSSRWLKSECNTNSWAKSKWATTSRWAIKRG